MQPVAKLALAKHLVLWKELLVACSVLLVLRPLNRIQPAKLVQMDPQMDPPHARLVTQVPIVLQLPMPGDAWSIVLRAPLPSRLWSMESSLALPPVLRALPAPTAVLLVEACLISAFLVQRLSSRHLLTPASACRVRLARTMTESDNLFVFHALQASRLTSRAMFAYRALLEHTTFHLALQPDHVGPVAREPSPLPRAQQRAAHACLAILLLEPRVSATLALQEATLPLLAAFSVSAVAWVQACIPRLAPLHARAHKQATLPPILLVVPRSVPQALSAVTKLSTAPNALLDRTRMSTALCAWRARLEDIRLQVPTVVNLATLVRSRTQPTAPFVQSALPDITSSTVACLNARPVLWARLLAHQDRLNALDVPLAATATPERA